jgi:hypothetical protein
MILILIEYGRQNDETDDSDEIVTQHIKQHLLLEAEDDDETDEWYS